MSTVTQVPPNGTGALPKGAKPILVTYDDATTTKAAAMDIATVSPAKVDRDTVVYFHTEAPGKVRIVFLSPEGHPTDEVKDSTPYTLAKGGFYHFNCYFTADEGAKEGEAVGGTLDVIPHKP